jgi:hypothetical protein
MNKLSKAINNTLELAYKAGYDKANQEWIKRIQELSEYCPVDSFMGKSVAEIQSKLLKPTEDKTNDNRNDFD